MKYLYSGLKDVLKTFKANKYKGSYTRKLWSISNRNWNDHNYDFTIYYKGIPTINYKDGKLLNNFRNIEIEDVKAVERINSYMKEIKFNYCKE